MVQPAHSRRGNDPARGARIRFRRTPTGSLLLQTEVRSDKGRNACFGAKMAFSTADNRRLALFEAPQIFAPIQTGDFVGQASPERDLAGVKLTQETR